ncbi:MAG: gliding motility-associated C-terminal domain-containing protein [Bacteroidales bacterium]|jgi:gliding motility-associated-like protein|nr:gliding motility-associated C-terminal domain-containing protein [Bacteroidales bacterium]
MYRLFLFLFTGLFIICGSSAYSQITSNADFSETTTFDDSIKIFVFCTDDEQGGMLTANDSSQQGGYVFEWFKYQEEDTAFTLPITENITYSYDSASSVVQNLASGGYKAILTKGDTVQEYIAWVYNNIHLSIDIQVLNPLDCDLLELSAPTIFETNFYSVDTTDGTAYRLNNEKEQYNWSSEPELESLRNYNYSYTSTAILPTENTVFGVTITDRFGCQAEDYIDYTAVETDALFKISSIDQEGMVLETSEESISGSAPLKVRFENMSENGSHYTYFFGDSLINNDEDTVFTTDYSLQPEHTYYYSAPDSGKTYIARLYSESSFGCRDSLFIEVFVEPTSIEFPNVFTPNNDNVNDIYQLTDFKSIRNFKITIFNRVGQVVHQYEGDARDWEGWDGTVKNSNRDAPDGNYFFVVEVLGWDTKTYTNKNLNYTGVAEEQESGGNFFGIIRLFR